MTFREGPSHLQAQLLPPTHSGLGPETCPKTTANKQRAEKHTSRVCLVTKPCFPHWRHHLLLQPSRREVTAPRQGSYLASGPQEQANARTSRMESPQNAFGGNHLLPDRDPQARTVPTHGPWLCRGGTQGQGAVTTKAKPELGRSLSAVHFNLPGATTATMPLRPTAVVRPRPGRARSTRCAGPHNKRHCPGGVTCQEKLGL